jgi:hypothetical protein
VQECTLPLLFKEKGWDRVKLIQEASLFRSEREMNKVSKIKAEDFSSASHY